jgi:group I intron endonuclease
MQNKCVIYKILCKSNNKFYVGRAVNFKKIMCIHKSRLRNNKHVNKHLQNLWNKYGEDNFEFLILETCEREQVCNREQYYLDLYINLDNCVNISKSSNNNTSSATFETRLKISASNKGKKLSQSTKDLLSIRHKGKKLSSITKEKIKAARAKQVMLPHEENTKLKISKANSGQKNSQAKLTWEIVREIREQHSKGIMQKELMKIYNTSSSNVSNIVNHKRWKEHDHNN